MPQRKRPGVRNDLQSCKSFLQFNSMISKVFNEASHLQKLKADIHEFISQYCFDIREYYSASFTAICLNVKVAQPSIRGKHVIPVPLCHFVYANCACVFFLCNMNQSADLLIIILSFVPPFSKLMCSFPLLPLHLPVIHLCKNSAFSLRAIMSVIIVILIAGTSHPHKLTISFSGL